MKYFFIVLLILLILTAILFLGCYFILKQLVMREKVRIPEFFNKFVKGSEMNVKKEDEAAAHKRFEAIPRKKIILTAPDGAKLSGLVLTPPFPNGKLIIACHGAGSSGKGEFCFFAPDFYRKGYTIIMPDHRGCGESDGSFMGYGTHESRDTFLWLSWAEKNFPTEDIFLLGVSMGAATVLMMSDKNKIKTVKGIIADCSYTSAWDEFSYQLKTSFHLPEFPLLHICNFLNKKINHYSFKAASPINCVKNALVPILFIHGEKDDFVPYYMMGLLYDECPSEKYRLTVPGAVHARSYYKNPELYTKAVEVFMSETLKPQYLKR